jgi:hypothetical protein
MNDLTERAPVGDPYRLRSQSGRRLADLLSSQLRAPLEWDDYAAPMEVDAVDGKQYVYLPDFVIRNTETGKTLFVALHSVYGLSLSMLVKFMYVNAAIRRAGDDFLLLVEGVADSDAIQRRLTDSDIRSVWFRDGVDAGAISAIRAALQAVG